MTYTTLWRLHFTELDDWLILSFRYFFLAGEESRDFTWFIHICIFWVNMIFVCLLLNCYSTSQHMILTTVHCDCLLMIKFLMYRLKLQPCLKNIVMRYVALSCFMMFVIQIFYGVSNKGKKYVPVCCQFLLLYDACSF